MTMCPLLAENLETNQASFVLADVGLQWKCNNQKEISPCALMKAVLSLQDAMRRAEEAGTQECPVKIKLVAPPLYVLTTQTLEKVSFSTHWWILYLWF